MNAGLRERLRITASLAVTCALGAAILGVLYAGTERYQRAAERRAEREALTTLLSLGPRARVTEVRQSYAPDAAVVIYRAAPLGAEGSGQAFAFTLDGAPAGVPPEAAPRTPLGRLFVAWQDGAPIGFVAEGVTRGYKAPIRFLVALDPRGTILGVRVLAHEEDPGLGAEVATPLFQGQFAGRDSSEAAALAVTRDPMPEDWRVALGELSRMPAATWGRRHGALVAREHARPIHAVTGATISSRALTDGVRDTIAHFRRRWALIAPRLGAPA